MDSSSRNPRDFHKCDSCGCYGTRSLPNFLKHVKQHRMKLQGHPNVFTCHSNIPEIYKCGNCDFETNLNLSLTHHMNLNHKNLENQNQFRNILRQCGYCDFQTHSMLFLLKHCLKCDKRDDLGADEVYDHVVNWLECGQCSYKSKEKNNLRRHMHIHTDFAKIEWYHCDKCKHKTKWKHHLKQHMAFVHADSANIVWYHCDKCEHRTKCKASLKKHVRNLHTDAANIEWYHCDKCEYKAKRNAHLKQHIAEVHTAYSKIAWYRCDKCDYKSKRKYALKRHTTKFHRDSANITIFI